MSPTLFSIGPKSVHIVQVRNCNSKTFASPSLGGYLRQFCFAETRCFVTSLF